MSPSSLATLPRLNAHFQRFFPPRRCQALWQALRPGQYPYRLTPPVLVGALLSALVLRMSGLREITRRCARTLGTHNFSSLCPALRRPVTLSYVQALLAQLTARHQPARDALVAVDGMAVTLPATTRHRCARLNHQAVGGGVIWACAVDAARGCCPVRVLKIITGAWNDCVPMQDVALSAHGPVYLMDRGFFALELFAQWLRDGVRFIVRVRHDAIHQLVQTLSAPRPYRAAGRIELDALARLGNGQAKRHPRVRLIRAVVGDQLLLLTTSELAWSAERVLDAYRKRERIERFHRLVKESIGLAHLYSFAWTGMVFLLHVALLLALLLIMGAARVRGREVVQVLQQTLAQLRAQAGLGGHWRRNLVPSRRAPSPPLPSPSPPAIC